MNSNKLIFNKNYFEEKIPPTFYDHSNRNDICPSIYSRLLGIKIFIDSKNPEEREEPNYPRFSVYKTNEIGETEEIAYETEVWQEILDFIEKLKQSGTGV
ncbi:MAG: hypothetical protein IBX50_09695 [Marinospirillum sp.]|uniref:hypothetical protein n=1 Tax=Marinospirillum sp. TaxID=2183934 RepID=UPI0019E6B904|nr:hypothetical protein [Marinospirillum sp.]MBE0506975.1 hypothetical protein [Marinospirillum sp.]